MSTPPTPDIINRPSLPQFLEIFDLDQDGFLSAEEISQIKKIPEATLAEIEEKTAYLVVLEILDAGRTAREKLVPTEGITFDEYRILSLLHTHGAAEQKRKTPKNEPAGLSQLVIATETNLSTSTVSSLLDKMDAARLGKDGDTRKWISRTENPHNRREKLVSLTHEGIVNFRLARKDYRKQIRNALVSTMPLERLLRMREALYHFNVSLDPKHDPSAGDSDD